MFFIILFINSVNYVNPQSQLLLTITCFHERTPLFVILIIVIIGVPLKIIIIFIIWVTTMRLFINILLLQRDWMILFKEIFIFILLNFYQVLFFLCLTVIRTHWLWIYVLHAFYWWQRKMIIFIQILIIIAQTVANNYRNIIIW